MNMKLDRTATRSPPDGAAGTTRLIPFPAPSAASLTECPRLSEAAASPQGAPPVAPPTGGPNRPPAGGPPPLQPPAGVQVQDTGGTGGGTIGTGTVPTPGEQGFSGNVQ